MEWYFVNERLKEDFLAYPSEIQADFLHKLEMITEYPNERFSFVRKEVDDIFKIKSLKLSMQTRLFFAYYERDIVLLHIFTKKTQKTPKQELQKAIRLYKQLVSNQKEQR